MEDTVNPITRFLKEFTESKISPTDDDVQVRCGIVGNYRVKSTEVEYEVMDWALNFLEQRKCPYSLSLILAKKVAEAASALVPRFVGIGSEEKDMILEAPQLYAETIELLYQFCEEWKVNPKWNEPLDLTPLRYESSVYAIKNIRRKMEDRHVLLHDLNALFNLKDVPPHSYYAVFDGHAGIEAASYASAHLHRHIVQNKHFLTDPERAITEAFKLTDSQFFERATRENLKSGCTAVCALISENNLYLSWLGDSQALLVKQGKPVVIMNPHKPDREDERKRIEEIGGCVFHVGTWRVNGTLAVSRALGDFDYKPAVSNDADVCAVSLDGTEDFLVIACDGLWDKMTATDVSVALYRHLVDNPQDYDRISAKLVHQSKLLGSNDNITTIVVFLRNVASLIADAPKYASSFLKPELINASPQLFNGNSENYKTNKQSIAESGPARPTYFHEELGTSDVNEFLETFTKESEDVQVNKSESLKGMPPEATSISELPTPPIDEVEASEYSTTDHLKSFQSRLHAQGFKTDSLMYRDIGICLDDAHVRENESLPPGILSGNITATDKSELFDLGVDMSTNTLSSIASSEVNQDLLDTASGVVQSTIKAAVQHVSSTSDACHEETLGPKELPGGREHISKSSNISMISPHKLNPYAEPFYMKIDKTTPAIFSVVSEPVLLNLPEENEPLISTDTFVSALTISTVSDQKCGDETSITDSCANKQIKINSVNLGGDTHISANMISPSAPSIMLMNESSLSSNIKHELFEGQTMFGENASTNPFLDSIQSSEDGATVLSAEMLSEQNNWQTDVSENFDQSFLTSERLDEHLLFEKSDKHLVIDVKERDLQLIDQVERTEEKLICIEQSDSQQQYEIRNLKLQLLAGVGEVSEQLTSGAADMQEQLLTGIQKDNQLPLAGGIKKDQLLLLTDAIEKDELLPLASDVEKDESLVLAGDVEKESLLLADDVEKDESLLLACDIEKDEPLPLACAFENDESLFLTCDIENDELLPLAGSVEKEELLPLAGGTEKEELLPVAGGVEKEELLALAGDVEKEELLALAGDVEKEELLALAGDVEKEELLPLAGGVEKEELLPLAGGVEKEELLPLAGGVEKEELLPLAGGVEKEELLPLAGGTEKEELLPLAGGTEKEELLPLAGGTEKEEMLPLARGVEKEELLPLVHGVEKGELLPLADGVEKEDMLTLADSNKNEEYLLALKKAEVSEVISEKLEDNDLKKEISAFIVPDTLPITVEDESIEINDCEIDKDSQIIDAPLINDNGQKVSNSVVSEEIIDGHPKKVSEQVIVKDSLLPKDVQEKLLLVSSSAINISDSVTEDSQVSNIAVDLQTIPDSIPEAEGVTEDVDSDSEKDGGWSYVKGNNKSVDQKTSEVTSLAKKGMTKRVTPAAQKDKNPSKTTIDPRNNKSKVSSLGTADCSKKTAVEKKSIDMKDRKEKPTSKASTLQSATVKSSRLNVDKVVKRQTIHTSANPPKPSISSSSQSTLKEVSKARSFGMKGSVAPVEKSLGKPILTSTPFKPELSKSAPPTRTGQTKTLLRPASAAASRSKDTLSNVSKPSISSASSKPQVRPSSAPLASKSLSSTKASTLRVNGSVPSIGDAKVKSASTLRKPELSAAKKQQDTKEAKESANKQILARKTVSTYTHSQKPPTLANKMESAAKKSVVCKTDSRTLKMSTTRSDVTKVTVCSRVTLSSKGTLSSRSPTASAKMGKTTKVKVSSDSVKIAQNLNNSDAKQSPDSAERVVPLNEEKGMLEANKRETAMEELLVAAVNEPTQTNGSELAQKSELVATSDLGSLASAAAASAESEIL